MFIIIIINIILFRLIIVVIGLHGLTVVLVFLTECFEENYQPEEGLYLGVEVDVKVVPDELKVDQSKILGIVTKDNEKINNAVNHIDTVDTKIEDDVYGLDSDTDDYAGGLDNEAAVNVDGMDDGAGDTYSKLMDTLVRPAEGSVIRQTGVTNRVTVNEVINDAVGRNSANRIACTTIDLDTSGSDCDENGADAAVYNKYQCPKCHRAFSSKRPFVYHSCFQKQRFVHCLHCKKRCDSLSSLYKHWERNYPTLCNPEGFIKLLNEEGNGETFLTCPVDQSEEIPHKKYFNSKMPFSCKICYRSFTGISDIRRHGKRHCKCKHFPCVLCEATFTDYRQFQDHWRYNHLFKRALEGLMFRQKEVNQNLFKSIKPQTEKTGNTNVNKTSSLHEKDNYQCFGCRKIFKQKAQLQKHGRICEAVGTFAASGKINKKPKCVFCGRMYETREGLKNHLNGTCRVRDLNKQEKAYCDTCGIPFPNHEALVSHIRQLHTAVFKCTKCDGGFTHMGGLRMHIIKNHPEDHDIVRKTTSNLCYICGKEYKTVATLTRHMYLHTDSNKYKCTLCDKAYASSQLLKRHYNCAHKRDKNYLCPYCGKRFLQAGGLNSHVRTHTGERPYKCEYCSESFKVQIALIVHRRKHTGETPFECDKCNKKFKTPSQLRTHVKIHSGVKEHKCLLCGEEFRLPHHLRAHIARKHSKDTADD